MKLYLTWLALLTGSFCFLWISVRPDPRIQIKCEIEQGKRVIAARHASLKVYNDIVRIEESK